MAIPSEVVTPLVLRKWDSTLNQVVRFAPWTLASRVENGAGAKLQDTIGEVLGLTTSLNVTTPGYILDASAGRNLVENKMGGCIIGYDEDSGSYWAQYGTDETTRQVIG